MNFLDLTWHRNSSGYSWQQLGDDLCLVDNLAPPEGAFGKALWAPLATVIGTCLGAAGEHLAEVVLGLDPARKPGDVPAGMERLFASYTFNKRTQDAEPLFPQLARTDPTREGVLKFAADFGPLGISERISKSLGEETKGQFVCVPAWTTYHYAMHYPETFAAWEHEIWQLRNTMSLWKAVVERDEVFLQKNIIVREDHVIFITQKPRNKMAALHHLERKLPTHVSPHLAAGNLLLGEMVGGPDVYLVDELVPCISDEKGSSGKHDHRFRMKSLRDAIWTELKDAIIGKYRYLSCLSCTKWIRIDKDSRRTNTRYCDTTCRQADCRRCKKVSEEERADARSLLPPWAIAPHRKC